MWGEGDDMGLFAYRLFGAATLDRGVYEGIEADRGAAGQAFAAVVLASAAAGFGAGDIFGSRAATFLIATILAVITWMTWAMLILQIGTHVLPSAETRTTFGELLRTTGFASAPGLLLVFAVLPQVRAGIFLGIGLWMFAAMVVGVRHALDYDRTSRALAVCGLAALLSFGVAFGGSLLFAPSVS